MAPITWKQVKRFGDIKAYECFHAANGRTVRLRLSSERLKANEELMSLVVPFHDFCSEKEERTQCVFEPERGGNLLKIDRVLFINTPSALDNLAELKGCYSDPKDKATLPLYVLLPETWQHTGALIAAIHPKVHGSLKLISGGTSLEFNLHAIRWGDTSTLSSSSAFPKLPEGSNHLIGRGSWFHHKTGRPGKAD